MRVTRPREGEPIRLVETTAGHRYRVVLDVSPKGSPRKQVTRTFDALRDARAFVDETRSAVIRGGFTAPSKVTLRQLAEAWLGEREAESEAGGIREVSVNGYRSALGTLRQVLAYGVEAGVLMKNPAATVKPPKAKTGSRRPVVVWTPGELAQFREHVDALPPDVLDADPWMRASMRLTLCGLRRSEVLGLDWSNVDLAAGLVRVTQGRVKTGRGTATAHGEAKSGDSHRMVPVEVIHPGTKAALREAWVKAGQPEAGLVVVDALGEPVAPDTYSRRFRALGVEAGVPDLGSIHNVRHTVATALLDNGVEPRKAASPLGHKVTTHLAFYVPTTDSGASEAAAVAGGLFTVAQ